MDRSAELYVEILNNNKKNLQEQIALNEQLLAQSKTFADRVSVNIASMKSEIEEIDHKIESIREQKSVYGKTESMNVVDEEYNSQKKEAIEMSNEIRDLRGKAQEVSSNRVKRKYYKAIEKKEDKLRKMTGKMTKIDNKQRRALLKKNKKEMFKQKMVTKERTRAVYYQEVANDYQKLKETTDDNLIGFVKNAIYDKKSEKAYKKSQKSLQIYNSLKSKPTCYVGSRNMTAAKIKCRNMARDYERRIMMGNMQTVPLTR